MDAKNVACQGQSYAKQAGQLVGVTADTWANWEKGKTNPDVKTAYKIAENFGLSIDDIIFR